ncbi:MAG: 4Fe-4S dicluster domain-containing protein [Candidatus Aminicenantes bacterium]|nr:4Fe-4S dicluster domain-containing protein [Candidatus Aminicenantes bacterium]
MAIETTSIKRETLEKLFSNWLSEGKRILAPKKLGDHVDFALVGSLAEVSLDQVQTVQSPKIAVFPRVEELLAFQSTDGNVQLRERDLAVLPETVIFGLRPCDAAAFASLKAIFDWDTPDKLFSARLEKITVVGLSCSRADEYCFCTSVGGGPGAAAGSDILLTDMGREDFLLEIISEKGRQAVRSVSAGLQPDAAMDKESRLARVTPAFTVEKISSVLAALFDDASFWEKQSLRCLGCGACAYVCPTCACFDIQDEGGASGKRLRCWDSCGFGLFTLHTSGHNPRPLQSQRWRQRLMHKFSYMPERQSVLGCVGCGRCSRACPVDMNMVEHMRAVAEAKP